MKEHSGAEEHEGESPSAHSRGRVKPTSGFFACASDTKILQQVVHPHAMLDSEETSGHDLALNDLSFH